MSITKTTLNAVLVGAVLVSLAACEEEKSTSAPKAPPSAAAMHSAPPPTAAPPPPSATATAAEPKHDCPEGSSGEGSSARPCEATGVQRTMSVTWTGKTGDDGPSFKVTNTSKLVILYGKIYVYFYDKSGKQLEVKDESSPSSKPRPYQTCAGRIFGGVMKAGEKATITFSCVKKQHVPEGATLIEGEVGTAGFADASGEKVDFYWHNADLTPDARPKGGIADPNAKGAKKKK